MKTQFTLSVLAVAVFSITSCSSHTARPQPKTAEQKSQFDGTTDALKKMIIPEIPSKQAYSGFRADQQKQNKRQENKTK